MDNRFGFSEATWQNGKSEMVGILRRLATEGRIIPYSDLPAELQTILIAPHDYAMSWILGEISEDEDLAARPLLSALVVYKETGKPGQGFYDLALKLGRKFKDQDEFWITEVQRIFDAAAKKN